MTRSHNPKMSVIQRRHIDNLKPLGKRHNRSITGPQRKISVGVDELGHPPIILARELDSPEITGSKRPQERRLNPRTPPGMQQIAHRSDDRGRQNHRNAQQDASR